MQLLGHNKGGANTPTRHFTVFKSQTSMIRKLYEDQNRLSQYICDTKVAKGSVGYKNGLS